MTSPVDIVASSLYEETPTPTLYHYTSVEALLSIVPSGSLWATDIHYLNDSSELRTAVEVLAGEVEVIRATPDQNDDLLSQLASWLRMRLANENLLFVVCFSENGNLLSQWRGYTPHGRGVSLGFTPQCLRACASTQEFEFGRCIYELQAQRRVAAKAVRAVVEVAGQRGPSEQAHPSQSYHPIFYELEPALLRVAALLKHGAFEAEGEWRLVSRVRSNYAVPTVSYRPGRTTLVPYVNFRAGPPSADGLVLEHVVLGPTPNNNLAMGALSGFFASHRISPARGLHASQLPYRET